MKRIIIAVVALATSLPAIQATQAEDMTIGLSWNSKTQPLERAWEDYMKAEAERQGAAAGLTIKWIVNVADADPSRQATNIEDLITQQVDVIVARAEDGGAIGASVRAANAAGIPFITFDRASKTVAPSAHVGGDSFDQAITTTEAFDKILGDAGVKGQCIEMQGALTDVNAVQRSKGWTDVVAKSANIETITQVPTEWNPELFRSGLANALRAHPEANCAFVASDFAITGVQAALEEAGKWAPAGKPNHFWLATQDLNPPAVPLMQQGYIDVATTYDAFKHAEELVRVAIALKKGEDPACGPDGCLAKGRVVTPATIATTENIWSLDYN